MATETACICVYLAMKMELRYLRWAPWRKGMTAEDVLSHHGVEKFADDRELPRWYVRDVSGLERSVSDCAVCLAVTG
jgi:hypothetical protein